MIGQFYWFAHNLIYMHCVVCLTMKRGAALQGQRESLCSLVAAMLQVEWRPLEETLLPLELLAAQGRPRAGPGQALELTAKKRHSQKCRDGCTWCAQPRKLLERRWTAKHNRKSCLTPQRVLGSASSDKAEWF